MSKKSKRPGRDARTVRDRIRELSTRLHAAPKFGVRDAGEMPDVQALMTHAMRQIEGAIPASMSFEGSTYWIRCELVARLAIYGEPGTAVPLIEGLSFSSNSVGHRPGH